jgi:hypothetical protein
MHVVKATSREPVKICQSNAMASSHLISIHQPRRHPSSNRATWDPPRNPLDGGGSLSSALAHQQYIIADQKHSRDPGTVEVNKLDEILLFAPRREL